MLEAISKIPCDENVQLLRSAFPLFSGRIPQYDLQKGLRLTTVPTLRWDEPSIFIHKHF
jgi:hypothetical protein